MHGLIELDVTEARGLISASDLSFTAFVVASVARAAAKHPAVHAYRDWRGRLITHTHVDVNTMVEVQTPTGPFPLVVVIPNASQSSVAEITTQLRRAKDDPTQTRNGRFLRTGAMSFARIPFLAATLFRMAGRSIRARQRTGTIAVTAVGMFGAGSGYGIGNPTIYSLSVVVGGISRQPREFQGETALREVLNLTLTVDHKMVDGAPAARFASDLRELIESAAVLQPSAAQ